jgi:uncharacterized protein
LIRPELVAAIRAQYRLPVVEMFAVFHDSGRRDEGSDAGHGRRGAELARWLRADRLDLARVGKQTDPRRLCTEAARDPELLAWASRRAAARVVPRAILEEWALDLTGFP